jgi:hypothetical protein
MADQTTAVPTPPPAPEEDKVPLLAALEDLGSTLGGGDIPTPANIHATVGAIVKVMQHAGVEVADDLWPAEPAVVARPETADNLHRQQTNTRLQQLEKGLADILDHLRGNGTNGDEDTEDKS